MKILQLTNRIPFPLNDGGNIGVHYYTQGYLDADVRLSMLAMNTTRHWTDITKLPPLYSRLQHFEVVAVDNRVKPLDAFFNLFSGKSYNITRFISEEYAATLTRLLQQEDFDIVQLEGLYLVPYVEIIRKYSKAKISIRQHNIEYKIWERLTRQAGNPLKKWYLSLLARRLKRFELQHINDYDIVLPISRSDEADYKALGCKVPLFLHPFGINIRHIPFRPYNEQEVISLYHIGAMDWLPNQESVDWLLEYIMPVLEAQLPQLKLYLAGRNMPQRYFQLNRKNVVVLGEVPDALAFERDKSILVVPLLSGGGVRIKIFQAMAMGKMIITTSVGVEGIEARDGEHIMLADTPVAFIGKIREAIADPAIITGIGKAARQLIEERYDQQELIARLVSRYRQLLIAGSE